MALKKMKFVVDYRNGDQAAHCRLCANFTAPHTCAVVVGLVNAGAICNLYARKGEKDA